jgi:hypothetical protein
MRGNGMTESTKKRRRQRVWRCALKWSVVGVITVVIAAVVVVVATGWFGYKQGPKLVRRVVAELESIVKGEVGLEGAEIELSRGATLQGIRVRPAPGAEPVLAVRRLVCRLDPVRLLVGRVVATTLEIEEPRARLEIRADGSTNLTDLLKPQPSTGPVSPDMLSGGVVVRNATVSLVAPGLYGDGKAREFGGLWLTLRPAPGLERWSLEGWLRAGPFAGTRISGYVDASGEAPDYDIRLEVPPLRIGAEHLALIPEVGGTLEKDYGLRGGASARVFIRPGAESPDEPSVRVLASLTDVSGQAPGFARPIRHISGSVAYQDGRLELENVRGSLNAAEPRAKKSEEATEGPSRESPVLANGYYDFDRGYGVVELRAQNLFLTEELVRALPGFGVDLWRKARPRGYASLEGRIVVQPAARPPVAGIVSITSEDLSLKLDLSELAPRMDGELGTVGFGSVSAHLFLDRRKLKCELSQAGCAEGLLRDGLFVYEFPLEGEARYIGRLQLSELRLAELMAEAFPKAKPRVGRLSGTLEIEGVLPNGDETAEGADPGKKGEEKKPEKKAGEAGKEEAKKGEGPKAIYMKGELRLAKAELYHLPVMLGLFKLLQLGVPKSNDVVDTVEATFELDPKGIQFSRLNLASEDVEFTAVGTIGLDKKLDLIVVTATRAKKGGIPIISGMLRTVVGGIQSDLTKVHVTGTWDNPKYDLMVLKPVTKTIRTLGELLPEL